jgi:ArsR family transcriptional regulator
MEESEQLAKVFRALMHPARLEILSILREGEQCVCHMEAHLGYRQAYISQHLTVLREAGLVEDRRDGWNIFYHVSVGQVFALIDQTRAMLGLADKPARKRPEVVDCPCPKCTAKRAAASLIRAESIPER